MATSIQFSTTEYQVAHGKMPRGYGSWAFFFDNQNDVDQAFWHNGKFADAKRMAMAWAVTKGHYRVRVGS